LVVGGTCWADTFYLKNHAQIVGKIVEETESEYTVNSYGFIVKIPKSEVVQILRSDQPQPSTPEPTQPQPATPIPAEPTPAVPIIATPTPTPTQLFPQDGLPPFPTPQEPLPTPTQTGAGPIASETDMLNLKEAPLLPVILPQGKVYQVVGTNVKFRQGPAIDQPEIETFSGSTILIGIGKEAGWVHARTAVGVEGWVHETFVREMQSVPCLVTGSGVSVRESAGEVYRSIMQLRESDVVLKLDERNEWWLILYQDSIVGWCNRQYLQPLTNEALYRPKMNVVFNDEKNQPVLMNKTPVDNGLMLMTFTVRDPQIVLGGKTNLLVLYRDVELFQRPDVVYMSE
jgi:SH3-like domain-containing protein